MKILYEVSSPRASVAAALVNSVAFPRTARPSIQRTFRELYFVLSSGTWRCGRFMMSGRLLCLNVWLRSGILPRTPTGGYIISRYTISRSERPKTLLALPRSRKFLPPVLALRPLHVSFLATRAILSRRCKIMNLPFYRDTRDNVLPRVRILQSYILFGSLPRPRDIPRV